MPRSAVDPSQPPVPPHCSGFGAQSTNYYGARTGASTLEAIAAPDSTVSVAAKAQHEPQPPWFLTGVTTPDLDLQS